MDCGVVEWVQCGALVWFRNMTRVNEDDLVKRIYEARIEGGRVRERPLSKWMNRVTKYQRVGR